MALPRQPLAPFSCAFIHLKNDSQRLESGGREHVSRCFLVWVPEISNSAHIPTTTTPGHHATKEIISHSLNSPK